MKLRSTDSLTPSQNVVGLERWDLQWDIDRLHTIIESKDREIGGLRFDIALLKAEVNALRGAKK